MKKLIQISYVESKASLFLLKKSTLLSDRCSHHELKMFLPIAKLRKEVFIELFMKVMSWQTIDKVPGAKVLRFYAKAVMNLACYTLFTSAGRQKIKFQPQQFLGRQKKPN